MQNAIRIDVEGNLDLRRATRGGRDAIQTEGSENFIIPRHRALALQHDNLDGRLTVAVSGKGLGLFRRNRRVAWNHRRRNLSRRLDTEREGSDVEEEHIANVAFEDAALDRRANSNDLVRIYALMGGLTAELPRNIYDLGHAGHAADQDELVDLG